MGMACADQLDFCNILFVPNKNLLVIVRCMRLKGVACTGTSYMVVSIGEEIKP